jgi:Lon protease-like protein
LREEAPGHPYRVAELELLPDLEPADDAGSADVKRRRLLQAFRELFPKHELDRVLRQALVESVPVGLLSDVLADALSLGPQVAQRVLSELDIERRWRLVLRLIHRRLNRRRKASRPTWPPRFSLN